MGGGRWKPPRIEELDLGDFTDAGQGGDLDAVAAALQGGLGDAEAARRVGAEAEAGDPKAQFVLGLMHAEGKGVGRDPLAAYMWARLAADRTTGKIHEEAARLMEHLALDMEPAAREEAEARARAWRLPEEKT